MKKRSRQVDQKGSALLMAILLLIVGGIVMGAMMTMTVSTAEQTAVSADYEAAYQAADAGINRTLFLVETELGDPNQSSSATQRIENLVGSSFSGTVGKGSYAVRIADPVPGDQLFDLLSEGQIGNGRPVGLGATIRVANVKALDYSLFGNYIHFDNHNKVNFGIQLTTSVFSNSKVEIDPGISISGTVRAVQYIEPSPASGNLEATWLDPAGEQGDPDPTQIPSAPVKQVQPAPQVQPFPAFDFEAMETLAFQQHRYLSSSAFSDLIEGAYSFAEELGCSSGSKKKKGKKSKGNQPTGNCAEQLNVLTPLPNSYYPSGLNYQHFPVNVIHHSQSKVAERRYVRIPTVSNPEQMIGVGSSNGIAPGPADTYEVIIEGDPLPNQDTVTYVDGSVSIDLPEDALLRLEGSLIVNGDTSVGSGVEMLAWENRTPPWFVPLGDVLYSFASTIEQVGAGDGYYDRPTGPIDPAPVYNYDIKYSQYPVIATNGKLKIGGSVGPAHIEGVIYTIGESHIHRSELQASVYICGTEIADIVHNCQYISFQYEPQARETMGLGNRVSGRGMISVVRYFRSDN